MTAAEGMINGSTVHKEEAKIMRDVKEQKDTTQAGREIITITMGRERTKDTEMTIIDITTIKKEGGMKSMMDC